jgi:hypothetical protein
MIPKYLKLRLSDSVVIALNAAFFIVLWRLARSPRIELADVVFAGMIAAIAYLTKLSFLYIFVGFCAAIGMAVLFGGKQRLRDCAMAAVFIFSVAAIVLVTAFWAIEWNSFLALLDFHQKIIFNGGIYGSGSPGVFNSSDLQRAASGILEQRAYAIPIAMVGGLFAMAGGLYAAVRRHEWLPAATFAVGAGAASLFAAATVLKHYALQYSSGAAVTLPALCVAIYLLLSAWGIRPRAPVLIAATVAVLAALVVPAIRDTDHYMEDKLQRTNDAALDRVKITELIARSPSPVAFAYRVPFPEFGVGYLLTNSGVPRLIFGYLAANRTTTSSMMQNWVPRTIGAYIIDKNYFRSTDDLKTAENVNLLGPTITFREGDEIIELATAYILVRDKSGLER